MISLSINLIAKIDNLYLANSSFSNKRLKKLCIHTNLKSMIVFFSLLCKLKRLFMRLSEKKSLIITDYQGFIQFFPFQ